MNEKYAFPELDRRIVYVKAIDVADLPQEMQAEAGDRDHVYAVHDAEGQQLALVSDRRMAFVLARQNDLAPVPVH